MPLRVPKIATWQHHSMTAEKATDLPMIESMRAGEIKKELESYGISTVSFLEKSELVNALTKARAEGLKPKASTTSSSSSSTTTETTTTTSTSSSKKTDTTGKPRSERLQEEMEKLKSMKASEMKRELEELGVSTKSFFEKQEFMKALAEARVDGVKKEESYAEYTNVEVLTDEFSGPRPKGQQSSASTSPYGGPVDGPGSVGGMGIADILKNMGAGGAGRGPFSNGNVANADPFSGSSPFGGANPFGGGNPFGGKAGRGSPFGGVDPGAFTKAQKMMKDPKVQEIIAKAQSNPSIMKKINECMSNPAAFAKYQNDPDVAELIKELRKFS